MLAALEQVDVEITLRYRRRRAVSSARITEERSIRVEIPGSVFRDLAAGFWGDTEHGREDLAAIVRGDQ